jgi:hypothetical protein
MRRSVVHLVLDGIAAGIVLATAVTVGMVWFDVMELGRLTRGVEGGGTALWVLWIGLLTAFTPVTLAAAFAIAAASADRDG